MAQPARLSGSPEAVSQPNQLRNGEDELERTVRELERSASKLERERDEARESASTGRRPYEELEEAYRKETAAHKETKELLNMVRVTAVVLFVLLVVGVLVAWLLLT